MRAAKRRAWLLAVSVTASVLVSADAAAQSGRVQGRVTDADTGQPIRSATIVAESSTGIPGQFTAVTDDKGRFAMLGLRTGTWVLSANAAGYEPIAGTARVQSFGQNLPVDIKLTRQPEPVLSPVARLDVKAYQEELRAAQALLDASRWDDAIAAYERLLTQLPTLSTLNFKIAEAYLQKKDTARAREAYARVPVSDPRYEPAQTAMGLLELQRGDVAAAERILSSLATDRTATAETLAALGDVRMAGKDRESALSLYRRAAEHDPSWTGPYMKLAQAALDRGDTTEAVTYLERAIAVDPRSADAEKARTLLSTLRKP